MKLTIDFSADEEAEARAESRGQSLREYRAGQQTLFGEG